MCRERNIIRAPSSNAPESRRRYSMYCPVRTKATSATAPAERCRSFIRVSGGGDGEGHPLSQAALEPVAHAVAAQRVVLHVEVLQAQRNVGVEVEVGALARFEFDRPGGGDH